MQTWAWLLLVVSSCVLGCGESGSNTRALSSGHSSTGASSSSGESSASSTGSTSSSGGTGGMGTGGGGGAGGGASAACPTYAQATKLGNVMTSQLKEISGVVESRKTQGVLWVHNDSGDSPRVFAVSKNGDDLGTYAFEGASATDWEDIAIGPGPVNGETYLYMGDIGDNAMARSNIKIFRAVEPVVDANGGPKMVTVMGVETITLTYSDGAHNAETLLVDPDTGDVFIVTKALSGMSQVFRATAPLSNANTIKMEEVGKLVFGVAPLSGDTLTTGGDISAQGNLIGIRTYSGAFVWRRQKGMSVAAAFAGEPCLVPQESEPQGEAFGFAADGSGYFTLGEGSNQPVHFYAKQ